MSWLLLTRETAASRTVLREFADEAAALEAYPAAVRDCRFYRGGCVVLACGDQVRLIYGIGVVEAGALLRRARAEQPSTDAEAAPEAAEAVG